MYSLLLDTSTDQCLIALTKENQVLDEKFFTHNNLLSNQLLPSIQALIEDHIQSPKNLSLIACGIGPGSYTGTRLGVAVAKSLAFGLQIPMKSFNSLLAFMPSQEGTFAILLPARSGQFYVLSGSVSFTRGVEYETAFCNPEELVKFEAVEFLICTSSKDLPVSSQKKSVFPLLPNMQLLSHFLSEETSTPLDDVELIYLNAHGQKH